MEQQTKNITKSVLDMMTSVFIIMIMGFAMVQVFCAVFSMGWNMVEAIIVNCF